MDIRIHEQLYSQGISDRKLVSLKKKIQKKFPKLDLFLVTLPLGSEGLLEVYWYPELLQKHYQQLDTELFVVGIATSREDAFHLIEQIVLDVGYENGKILIKDYFKVS
jgi:hypothetical protein